MPLEREERHNSDNVTTAIRCADHSACGSPRNHDHDGPRPPDPQCHRGYLTIDQAANGGAAAVPPRFVGGPDEQSIITASGTMIVELAAIRSASQRLAAESDVERNSIQTEVSTIIYESFVGCMSASENDSTSSLV